MRQMIEAAVAAGRELQSEQTGFIHHHYHIPKEERPLTIPLYENFLFILALFRSRSVEHVQEAKERLHHLLSLQLKESGGFPLYFHEYPLKEDRLLGCRCLPLFCRLLKEFQPVLGVKLFNALKEATEALLKGLLGYQKEKAFGMEGALPLALSLLSYGTLFHDKEIILKGEALEKELIEEGPVHSWYSPSALGEAIVTLSLVYEEISKSPWNHLWSHFVNSYHPHLHCYAGPLLEGFQCGKEAQKTLYDVLLSAQVGQLPPSIKYNAPLLLQASLVYPIEPLLKTDIAGEKAECEGMGLSFQRDRTVAYSTVSGGKEEKHPQWKGIHDFQFLWKGKREVRSFIAQKGGTLEVKEGAHPFEFHCFFHVKEEASAIDFYLNQSQEDNTGKTFLVEGIPANSFRMREEVTCALDGGKVRLFFELVEGEGEFRGHIMPGNRPSQLELKGENRFNAYDWRIFLRPLRGAYPFVVKATLLFQMES